ncbi:uncharacterized protein LOC144904783 isoform X1 [Branchiostoma floridae x Branchiostoma belcheri]
MTREGAGNLSRVTHVSLRPLDPTPPRLHKKTSLVKISHISPVHDVVNSGVPGGPEPGLQGQEFTVFPICADRRDQQLINHSEPCTKKDNLTSKLYKSKVCFTKHLWEHSVYWDLFDGEKNHDRVLSIQAALILYKNFQLADRDQNSLSFLLVTGPHSKDAKTEHRSDSASPKTKPRHRHDSKGKDKYRQYVNFHGNHDNERKEQSGFHSNKRTDDNTERYSGDGHDNMTTLLDENRCHGDAYDGHHRSPVSNGASFHGDSCHDSRFYGIKRMKMI